MIMQAKAPDTVAVADIGTSTLQRGARQMTSPAVLTCAWVRTDDGALVMRWTRQRHADAYEQMTKAAA